MRDGSPPVLVLGATGRVGGEIVANLVANGRNVRAATRRARESDLEGVEYVPFDLTSPATWSRALDGVMSLFLMWPPGTTPEKNVFPFLELAKSSGVERVVFLSVLGADTMTFLPHAKIEARIQKLAFSFAFLRAGYFMQNFSTMHADDIIERNEIALPAGNGRLCMVDVTDVGAAGATALVDVHDNVAWDLTGPDPLSMADVAQKLTVALGRPIRHRKLGALRFFWEQIRRGQSTGLVLFMVAEYTHARMHKAARKGDGVQLALGRPPTSFEGFAVREQSSWAVSDDG